MVGIYFSGTGNTKHCVEYFLEQYGGYCSAVSIESPDAPAAVSSHSSIVLGYPVYFSNAPKIVQDFIAANAAIFYGKKVFIIATMAMFSGDGAGCTARLLKKHGAVISGGLHLKMPDSIGDEKVLKKSAEKNRKTILAADEKIAVSVQRLKKFAPDRDGLSAAHHLAGLLGQRLWFYGMTLSYKNKPNINTAKCTGCGKCTRLCPMKNISLWDKKAVSHNRCTLCYRCFSYCPSKAITILGKRVHEQYLFENYYT